MNKIQKTNKKEKMDLTKYAFFKNYIVSEFQLTCYPQEQQLCDFEHELFKNFQLYDDDFIFEEDGGLSILLPNEQIANATNVNQFTNFNKVVELSQKFVNTNFVYSIEMQCAEEEDVELFIDVYVKGGIVTGDKCVGCVFDDTLVD
jgi:hypothetical protein